MEKSYWSKAILTVYCDWVGLLFCYILYRSFWEDGITFIAVGVFYVVYTAISDLLPLLYMGFSEMLDKKFSINGKSKKTKYKKLTIVNTVNTLR